MIVVGEARDGEEAIQKVAECGPDVLLLDLAMPRVHGADALRHLFKTHADVKTIVLTAAIEPSEAVEALRCGARGIVLKETATEQLFDAIRAVVSGEFWIGREGVSHLVDALRSLSQKNVGSPNRTFGLTQRELQIVAAIRAGSSNKAIATEFHISEQTVKNHLTAIFNKLGVSTRLELALFASQHNLSDNGA
jgi:DNA-binding NarL/FixJ family response regulator